MRKRDPFMIWLGRIVGYGAAVLISIIFLLGLFQIIVLMVLGLKGMLNV